MADELTIETNWRYLKGNDEIPAKQIRNTVTVAGTIRLSKIFAIATSETEIDISDVADPGWARLRNLDATNYLQIGPATTVYMLVLKAGEAILIRLDPGLASLFCKANTGAVSLLVELLPA
jgi:hypothetical protein